MFLRILTTVCTVLVVAELRPRSVPADWSEIWSSAFYYICKNYHMYHYNKIISALSHTVWCFSSFYYHFLSSLLLVVDREAVIDWRRTPDPQSQGEREVDQSYSRCPPVSPLYSFAQLFFSWKSKKNDANRQKHFFCLKCHNGVIMAVQPYNTLPIPYFVLDWLSLAAHQRRVYLHLNATADWRLTAVLIAARKEPTNTRRRNAADEEMTPFRTRWFYNF